MNSFIRIVIATVLPAIFTFIFLFLDNKTAFKKIEYIPKQIIIGFVFGGLAILGTEYGIPIPGATANVRDGAVITAGLIFGAPSGIIAGIIGGVERYYAAYWGAGTYTQIACTVSTILAGFYSAFIRKYVLEDRKPGPFLAFTIGLVIEVFHMTMVFITNMSDANKALEVVNAATVVMVPANSIACLISAFVASLRSPKAKKSGEKETISNAIQKSLLVVVTVVFILTSIFVINLQISIANNQSEMLLKESIEDVINDVVDTSNENLLAITRKITKEVSEGKTIEELGQKYGVNDISIANSKGIIIDSLTEEFIGFNFKSGDQASEFLVLLDSNSNISEYVQEYKQISLNEDVYRKYAAVKYEDGFIQVGYDAVEFQTDIANAVKNVTKNRHIGENGFMFIADENGITVGAPNDHKNIVLNECSVNSNDPDTTYEVTISGIDYLCQYSKAEGYTLVALYPKEEAYRTRDIAIYANSFMEIMVFGLMFAMIYMLIKKIVLSKIEDVNKSLAKITNGDLNEEVNVKNYAEFNDLSNDINATVNTLKRYIAEASARIDTELEYAKTIQSSSLPHSYPTDERFELYTLMDTAKEVGGDFYDFYTTKADHLNFMIADVSGKGIPGALFMMRAKSELHSLTELGHEVNDVFTDGNNRLCQGNDAGMFVTAWQGDIDLNSGLVKFVNAGHNHPVIIKNDGTAEFISEKTSLILAGMEDIKYKAQSLQLNPGDILLLYTDGVVEATNAQEELYGNDRLIEAVKNADHNNMQNFCSQILDDVNAFVKEAEQFDDITMVAIKYNGNK